jgi:hypothetical protein
MSRKLQVLVELDLETKQVTTTGPMEHPGVVVKMLAAALAQVGDSIAAEQDAREKEKAGKPAIIIPKLRIGRAN